MRERKTRKLIMYGLMAAVMATTVAYAVLQTTLNISGTVTKKGGSWDIHFANLSTPTLTGDASVENADLQGTTFDFDVTVVKPGDSIVYTFDVVNGGSIDATLDSYTLTGATEAKAQDITYTLTYADGKAITKGDYLKSEQTRTLKLTVSYDDVEELGESTVTLDLGATLIYVQSDEIQEGNLPGNIDTPLLTSVTLTDLKNNGKLEASYPEAVYDMTIQAYESNEGMKSNDVIINLNGYAKTTGSMLASSYNNVIVTFEDGSIHKVSYVSGENVMVPSGSEMTEVYIYNGWKYEVDGVVREASEGGEAPLNFEGNIATIKLSIGMDASFTEILIEE